MKKEIKNLQLQNNNIVNLDIPIYQYTYDRAKELSPVLEELLHNYDEFFDQISVNNPAPSFYSSEGNHTDCNLTNKNKLYNILDSTHIDEIVLFRKFLYSCFIEYTNEVFPDLDSKNLFVKCWGNIFKPNQRIKIHSHYPTLKAQGVSAHYNFGSYDNQTATRYMLPIDRTLIDWKEKIKAIENFNGLLTLMPIFLHHDTTPNRSQIHNRYSLGFDMTEIQNKATEYEHCWIRLKDLK